MRISLLSIALLSMATWSQGQDDGPLAQRICGPRVCEYVLQCYNRPVEAIDLVWEMQVGRSEQPVDIATLSATLGKRGVKTRAIQLSEPGLVDWPKVCIYHTLNSNGTGHFIVQVPSEADRPRLFWCNYLGFSKTLHSEYDGRLTGYVLLTSLEDIPANTLDELTVLRPSLLSRRWIWVPLAAVVSGVVFWLCSRREASGRWRIR